MEKTEQRLIDIIKVDSYVITLVENYFETKIEEGYIYCLWNEIFGFYDVNMYKVGKSNNVEKRKDNYNMYYLKNPEIKHTSCKNMYNDVAESMVFNILRKYKMEENREFVKCDVKIIINTIDYVCKLLNDYYKNKSNIETCLIKIALQF